jgi:hypothetical protein
MHAHGWLGHDASPLREFGFVLPKIEIWLHLHSSSIPGITAALANSQNLSPPGSRHVIDRHARHD